MEAPIQIRAHALQNVPTPVLAQLPSRNAIKILVKRTRKEENAPPAMPNSIDQLVIPEAYRHYQRTAEQHEQFLLGDSGVYTEEGHQGRHRILIFGRVTNGNWAAEMNEVFVDGTFSLAPPLFYQIFALLAKKRGWVFPVAYGLMTTKTTASYARFFRMVKEIWPLFNPKQVSSDFEPAIIAAVQQVFPMCGIAGCLFHLVRNMKKSIADAGLTQRYNTDPQFSLDAKLITSLAFLPIEHLTAGIRTLEEHLPPELHPVFDW